MATQVIKVKPGDSGTEAARQAAQVLRDGGLVAFPTETVYGVAARADTREAMGRLRTVKARGENEAFTVHIGTREDASRYVPQMPGIARRLIHKAWPGPLTLVLPVESPSTTPIMNGLNGSAEAAMYYDNTVGLRCPAHPVAEALLRQVGAPVVASSANLAGRSPPLAGGDVLRDLNGRIDLLVDAGRTQYARASTIVEITGGSYRLVREGVYDAGIVKRLATMHILFVCTGNTCRSPMAAGLARKMLADRLGCAVTDLPAQGVFIESAGIGGGVGGASEHAIAVMTRRGIDIRDHRSRALAADLIRQADHVFAMTKSQLDRITELVPASADYASTLCPGEDVADPISGGEDAYEQCARRLEEGLSRRLQEVPI